MRDITFRGNRLDVDEWIEGNLRIYPSGRTAIMSKVIGRTLMVDPASVGQFTGLVDAHGVRIYEGDYISGLFYSGLEVIGKVEFQDGAFGVNWQRGDAEMFTPFSSTCNILWEVLGKVYVREEQSNG